MKYLFLIFLTCSSVNSFAEQVFNEKSCELFYWISPAASAFRGNSSAIDSSVPKSLGPEVAPNIEPLALEAIEVFYSTVLEEQLHLEGKAVLLDIVLESVALDTESGRADASNVSTNREGQVGNETGSQTGTRGHRLNLKYSLIYMLTESEETQSPAASQSSKSEEGELEVNTGGNNSRSAEVSKPLIKLSIASKATLGYYKAKRDLGPTRVTLAGGSLEKVSYVRSIENQYQALNLLDIPEGLRIRFQGMEAYALNVFGQKAEATAVYVAAVGNQLRQNTRRWVTALYQKPQDNKFETVGSEFKRHVEEAIAQIQSSSPPSVQQSLSNTGNQASASKISVEVEQDVSKIVFGSSSFEGGPIAVHTPLQKSLIQTVTQLEKLMRALNSEFLKDYQYAKQVRIAETSPNWEQDVLSEFAPLKESGLRASVTDQDVLIFADVVKFLSEELRKIDPVSNNEVNMVKTLLELATPQYRDLMSAAAGPRITQSSDR
ncbi:MAG: hypothetical protein COT74_09120 [Bdellovibrionales bacterium CG10_big_fil_rev_8_21_14_0_10_45_34]|nr:MAG: hypothetical protein COT74_09120 [Bdellovibrionales bacterium CG10_big_fil_rev_8_21_14_0_10_45_34]